MVLLRVSPVKGIRRFGKRGKLAPRFIGPFEILQRIGSVAYRLALPEQLANVHPVFHVSMLRKHVRAEDQTARVDVSTQDIRPDVTVSLEPEKIVDSQEKFTRNRKIKTVKVQWSKNERDVTWELEDDIRRDYPHLFEIPA